MTRINNRIQALGLLMLAFLCCSAQAFAAEVEFTAKAPNSVVMGSQFELAYTINARKVNDFRAPSFDNFDVLIGPSRSVQSYTSIVNGKSTHVENMTYTYILMPRQEGSFTIPGATVKVNGKEYSSNSLNIKVLPEDDTTSGSAGGGAQGVQRSSNQISSKDIFVLGQASKTKVMEQEAILLTYKM